MKRVIEKCLLFLIASLVALPSVDAQENKKVVDDSTNKATIKQAMQIVDGSLALADAELAARISTFIRKHRLENIAAADEHLAKNGQKGLGDLFAKSIVSMSLSGQLSPKSKWSLKESAILAPRFKSEIDEILDAQNKAAFMNGEVLAPAEWNEYEDLLWRVHVMRNRLAYATMLCDLCAKQTSRYKESKSKTFGSLNPAQQAALRFDFGQQQTDFQKLERDLLEREIELRFYRLEDSVQVLKNSKDKKQKLLAGFAIQHDHDVLTDFFASNSLDDIQRSNIRDETIADSVQEIVRLGRKHGQDQIRKGTLLMVGLHWWLRGRYGAGPLANGQLKPESAMKNPDDMFALFMPRSFRAPSPPNDYSYNRLPNYERRHYHHWSVEYRPVQIYFSQSGYTQNSPETINSTSKTLNVENIGSFW